MSAFDYTLESIHESIRMHSSRSISCQEPWNRFGIHSLTWGDVNSANRFACIIERTHCLHVCSRVYVRDTVKAEIFGGVIFSVFAKIGGSVAGNFR